MDFIVADRFIADSSINLCYSEDIIRLPVCYQPNNRLSEEERGSEVKISKDHVVANIGCLNASYKITPEIFLQWLRILRTLPFLRLYLLGDTIQGRANLLEYSCKNGFSDEFKRVIHLPKTDRAGYLKYFQFIDLFVDTFPYGAHTTASDCLRMAKPIVTLAGNSFASRVCGSLLHHINADVLVTYDVESYKQKIIELCSNRTYYGQIANQIKVCRCTLFNPTNYAAEFIEALPK
jgi:predicted O-linked N-acetylglucosamine transferase (SPINDLY family)